MENHRYINFTFTGAGKGGGWLWQKTGTVTKFGQKTGTFTHIQPNFACFYIHIFADIFIEIMGHNIPMGRVKNCYTVKNIYTRVETSELVANFA